MNLSDSSMAIHPLVPVTRLNWRTQVNYRLNRTIELRSRVETVWFASNLKQHKETGFLFYAEVHVKPAFKPFFFNARIQYIETDGYNSRIYAWENTVLYNFSIPALFNKALRYIINVNYRLMPRPAKQYSKKFNCLFSLSFAQAVYPSEMAVDATKTAVDAFSRSDIKLQVIFARR
jgi:hypothetical protein